MSQTRKNRTQFTSRRQPYTCIDCGKRTTGAVGDISTSLCPACYETAGIENEHQDGLHDTPDAACPMCAAEAEASAPEETETLQINGGPVAIHAGAEPETERTVSRKDRVAIRRRILTEALDAALTPMDQREIGTVLRALDGRGYEALGNPVNLSGRAVHDDVLLTLIDALGTFLDEAFEEEISAL